jgi:hypothetical protein
VGWWPRTPRTGRPPRTWTRWPEPRWERRNRRAILLPLADFRDAAGGGVPKNFGAGG